MKVDLSLILQITIAVMLLFVIYQDHDNESQLLIWLEDAEAERSEIEKRIRSMENHLNKTDNYAQTE